jgi:hypothetical protein
MAFYYPQFYYLQIIPTPMSSPRATLFLKTIVSLVAFATFVRCSTTHPKYQLSDDYYLFKIKGGNYKSSFAYVSEDTILVYAPGDVKNPLAVDPLKQFTLQSQALT